jgi:hypothetical protein
MIAVESNRDPKECFPRKRFKNVLPRGSVLADQSSSQEQPAQPIEDV